MVCTRNSTLEQQRQVLYTIAYGIHTEHNLEISLKLPTPIIKQSVVIAGHATSVSLEPEFWEALREIANADGVSVAALIRQIDETLASSQRSNLSSAIRVFILKRFQEWAKSRGTKNP